MKTAQAPQSILVLATRTTQSRGLTIVESAISVLLVGVVMVAALQSASLSLILQQRASVQERARFLATGLMNDVLQEEYEEPSALFGFGRESGESNASKTNYDDVDDYNGWSESPPQDRDGVVIPRLTNWRRSVTVERVTLLNLNQSTDTETGVKRITVRVYHKGALVATRRGIRAKLT